MCSLHSHLTGVRYNFSGVLIYIFLMPKDVECLSRHFNTFQVFIHHLCFFREASICFICPFFWIGCFIFGTIRRISGKIFTRLLIVSSLCYFIGVQKVLIWYDPICWLLVSFLVLLEFCSGSLCLCLWIQGFPLCSLSGVLEFLFL